MIKRAEYFAGKPVFEDQEKGRTYRRVVGALGWPARQAPGGLVVLAEGLTVEKGLGTRPLWLLAEAQGASVAELYRHCRAMGKLYAVADWLADLDRPEEINWFMHLDSDRQPGVNRAPVYLSPAPYCGPGVTLGMMMQVVDEQYPPRGKKILTFGEDRALRTQIEAIKPEDLKQPAHNFPGLAALGYAVAELVFNGEPEEWQRPLKHQTLKDYQPGR